jgi:hypothetical protein
MNYHHCIELGSTQSNVIQEPLKKCRILFDEAAKSPFGRKIEKEEHQQQSWPI